ncbi:DivIVA domain-containing protein [Asanoa sp. NPDC049518]|uniref:DivIVA domain-containing protein n=1 Tax=unclassified Asanoa TaxID=2685164 RepID=UPI00341B87A4
MTDFDISLRGYDRHTVDTLVRAVHAAAGDHDRIEALIAEAEPLAVALRGYDRAQVDAWLASRGRPQTTASELRPTIVLRGYRIAETDALLATAESAIGTDDPFRRAAALRAIAEARLPVSFRGYDRGQVDAHLRRVTEALA